jgi:hypothetical protein
VFFPRNTNPATKKVQPKKADFSAAGPVKSQLHPLQNGLASFALTASGHLCLWMSLTRGAGKA